MKELTLVLYCMLKLWSDAYFTDDELFRKAEETILSEGEQLQKLADEVFASWKSLEQDGEWVFPGFDSPLFNFERRLRNFPVIGMDRHFGGLGYEKHSDYHRHQKILHWEFGPRSNVSWLVVYPSWEDVSDVEGVRWITGHVGVRDSGVIYYPDHVETIRQITPKDY